MKKVAALLFILSVAALAAFTTEPPKPKLRSVASSFAVAPDSTVTAALTVYVTGTMQPGDSLRFKVYKDGSPVFNKLAAGTSLTVSGIPAPVYGATSSYKGCAIMTRGGVNAAGATEVCGLPWTYTRPAPPPPPPATVDSVVIRPASWTGTYGQGSKYCGVQRTTDGAWHLPTVMADSAFCGQVIAAVRMGV